MILAWSWLAANKNFWAEEEVSVRIGITQRKCRRRRPTRSTSNHNARGGQKGRLSLHMSHLLRVEIAARDWPRSDLVEQQRQVLHATCFKHGVSRNDDHSA